MTPLFLAALAAAQITSSGHALTVQVTQPAVSGSIPLGAQRVPMLTVALKAACTSDVTLRSIRVSHSGLGSTTDIERVYAVDANRRVSRAAGLTRNPAEALLRFGSFKIPACQTKTLNIVADYSPTADVQSEHALSIGSFDAIYADTEDIGGNVETRTQPTRVAPTTQGTVEVEYLPQLSSVLYGPNRTLLRMRLTAEGDDVLIRSITLTNDGKARDADLKNLSLGTRTGTLSNTLATMDGDKAVFTFDPPLLIEKGQDRQLQLNADVRASRKKTIDFEVGEPGDIDVTSGRNRSDTFQ